MKIILDFETRSEVDLVKVGPWIYSKHPSTEILCVSFYSCDWGSVYSGLDISEFITYLIFTFKKVNIEAHNAFFEKSIWINTLPKYDVNEALPKLNISWSCSAAKSSYNGLPRSLAGAAFAAGIDMKKDMDGRKLMLKMCKPRKPTKTNKEKWHETPEDLKRLSQYCDQDVLVESQLSDSISPLNKKERLIWELDQRMNMRGLPIDLDLVNSALDLSNQFVIKKNKEVEIISKSELDGVTRRAKVMEWCFSQGVILKEYTAPYLREILQTKLPDNVRQVLQIRSSLGKTSVAKYKTVKAMTDTDDYRLRGSLVYYGCFTGRWAGSGFQPQNLPRGANLEMEPLVAAIKKKELQLLEELYDDPMMAISTAIRGAICASNNKTLFCVDYSAIESRVVLWLAQDERALELFRKGKDLYIDMAADIFNIKPEDVTKQQRQLGKTAILGLGYGMGATKFFNTCNIPGLDITENFAQKVVNTYRDKYESVTRLWRSTEAAFRQCVKKDQISDVSNSKYFYFKSKSSIKCKLPSGRNLSYMRPMIDADRKIIFKGVDPKTRTFKDRYTWGGELVQNATQAVARDILAEAMLRVDEKYPVILTVHDEIVSEVDENRVNEFDNFLNIVKIPPTWGKDIPLDVEGWCGKRYRK